MSVLKELESIRDVVKSSRITEKEKRDAGIDYDEKYVRQSIVHSREDIIFLCIASSYLLDQAKKTNRNLQILIFLFGIFILIFLIR